MSKTFRDWDVEQGWLLSPSVLDFVPPDHLAHFVRDTVRESLDLSAIMDSYTAERGYPLSAEIHYPLRATRADRGF